MYTFSDVELFALFISCLCHDIDHRGTTNAFQLSSVSIIDQWALRRENLSLELVVR